MVHSRLQPFLTKEKPAKIPHEPAHPKRKATIPKALREQVWRTYNHEKFEEKCFVRWCTNRINAFNFEVGHNIPESKGGSLELNNLRPICSQCNRSMGNKYTIDEWTRLSNTKTTCGCFG